MGIDLNAITDTIKSILDAANTTTALPLDLSKNLTSRVQRISKLNPAKIPLQASLFPLVTMYYDNKEITQDSIAKNQVTAARKAIVNLKIVACVWNSSVSTYDEDSAEEEVEVLTENIETILRSNETLSNKVSWCIPTNIQYFTNVIDENTHIRTSETDLKMVIFY
jgi:hypothetical protein